MLPKLVDRVILCSPFESPLGQVTVYIKEIDDSDCNTVKRASLLGAYTGAWIRDLDAERFCPLEDLHTFSSPNRSRYLSGVCLVMHQQKIDVLSVSDQQATEAIGHKIFRPLVTPVADLWHRLLALEAAPDTVIDSPWLPPALPNAVPSVGLMAYEFLRAFLDDGDGRSHSKSTDVDGV